MEGTDNNLILNKIKEYKDFKTDVELADFLGISRQNLSAWRTRNSINVNSIVDKLPELRRSWLLTGEGTMLKANIKLDKPMEFSLDEMDKALEVAERMGVDLIPLYTEPFRAGNQGHNLIEEWDYVESVWAIPDTQADRLVPVEGDSMEPTIPNGSAVAISPYFFRPDEPLSIPFGDIFAIVIQPDHDNPDHLRDHIKRLYRHPDHDKHLTHWIARSDNPRYEDFEVRIDRVASLWRIKASITVQRF